MAAKDATKQIETMTEDATKAVNDGMEKFTKGFSEAATFNQETVDALVKSGNVAAKAAESLNAEVVAYAKRAMQEGVAAAKEMSSVKSVTDLVEKQTDYAKMTMDAFLQQTTKLNEMYMAAAKEAVEPINARVSAAADAMKAFRV